ncbi:MAG: DNA-directed RNA polymerase subunit beta, partial [Clostridiales bacterium]|nr:DNA-directed RNA polymerase subunit beta [Clostridiales bacterium]
MIKEVYFGNTLRRSFERKRTIIDMPSLLDIQKKSYKWFLETGLREVFEDVGAITDYQGNLELT